MIVVFIGIHAIPIHTWRVDIDCILVYCWCSGVDIAHLLMQCSVVTVLHPTLTWVCPFKEWWHSVRMPDLLCSRTVDVDAMLMRSFVGTAFLDLCYLQTLYAHHLSTESSQGQCGKNDLLWTVRHLLETSNTSLCPVWPAGQKERQRTPAQPNTVSWYVC